MIKYSLFVASFVVGLVSLPGYAENKQAYDCQIFIKSMNASPNSHGSAALEALVKVNWLGNDEQIEKVQFWGRREVLDLGKDSGKNGPNCFGETYQTEFTMHDIAPAEPGSFGVHTEIGEYLFHFNVRTGSVVDSCPGYHFTWIGTFYVQTNKNTYWINPNNNPNEYFYFDNNGFENVWKKSSFGGMVSTHRDDMKYYNPRSCQ